MRNHQPHYPEMKIVHTSDWHIGQNFYLYERDDEHRHFFAQLTQILKEEKPDALLVSGDIYHNAAPSAQSQKLLVEGVLKIKRALPDMEIVITSGNHDSGSRLDADKRLWQEAGVYMAGSARRADNGTFDPSQFIIEIPGKGIIAAVPYFHPSNYPLATPDTKRENRAREFYDTLLKECGKYMLPIALMAHMAVRGCEYQGHNDISADSGVITIGGMETEDISVFGTGYDYLALGHIHKPQRITPRAYYCGSPLPVSFAEDYDHYVNIVEIEAHGDTPKVTRHKLTLLREVKTIPPEGAPLEEALEALRALPDDDTSYIRLLVDQEGTLPANADDKAAAIALDKKCRLCEVYRKPRLRTFDTKSAIVIDEVADLERYTPEEIAKESYRRTTGNEMPAELFALLREAINL